MVGDQLPYVRFPEQVIYHILPLPDLIGVLQREKHPSSQHTGTHRSNRLINHIKKGDAVLIHRVHQFQVTDGELVQTDKAFFLDSPERGDMLQLQVLGHNKVLQDNTSCHNTVMEMVYSKTLQVLYLEMLMQFLLGRTFCKAPVVQRESNIFGTERAFEHSLLASLVQHLLG